ncbi:MAG: prepilin-type N-terminal cleavage/methylation domain-containing protein [Pseudomonadota bacterium]|nr:prepilin-type N-terminal cleavage/methylation domain-containing protein [Pseudomonadota bacterium]
MTSLQRTRPAASRGFTLIEVLIALVLLSLLMLALTGALRAMGQTETRVDQRIEAGEDYRLAHDLLRQVLGHVSGRTFRPTQVGAGPEVPFFMGDEQTLRWVGVMPARYGSGGRHYMRLAVEPVNGQPRWVLRFAPWNGAPTFDQWASASAQAIAAAPADAAFSTALAYRDPRTGQWLNAWPPAGADAQAGQPGQPPRLPDAVRIDVTGPAPAWPPMLLAVGANYLTDPGAMRATFGGGR